MEFHCNPGKKPVIRVDGEDYLRHAIQTHFVTVGEDYVDLIRRYVLPLYEEGDLVAVSEKVAALCQGRVIYREEISGPTLISICCPNTSRTGDGPPHQDAVRPGPVRKTSCAVGSISSSAG